MEFDFVLQGVLNFGSFACEFSDYSFIWLILGTCFEKNETMAGQYISIYKQFRKFLQKIELSSFQAFNELNLKSVSDH